MPMGMANAIGKDKGADGQGGGEAQALANDGGDRQAAEHRNAPVAVQHDVGNPDPVALEERPVEAQLVADAMISCSVTVTPEALRR